MKQLYRIRWGLLVLLLGLSGWLLRYAEAASVPDNSLSVWFLQDDPTLQGYQEFQRQFGNDEVLLIHLPLAAGVNQPKLLPQLTVLGSQLESLQGVAKVHSLANFKPPGSQSHGSGEKAATSLEQRAKHPLAQGTLVSKQGDQLLVWVQMQSLPDFDAKRDRIVNQIREVCSRLAPTEYHLAGVGVLYTGLNEVTEQDFGTFLGLGYLLLLGAMGWVFRSWILALAAAAVLLLATAITVGALGAMGQQLNMVTAVLPIVVMVLGTADLVHFPAAYQRIRKRHPEYSPATATIRSLTEVFWPCLLTTATTVAGFLSLAGAPMAVIRDLGIYAAVGVSAALLSSIIIMLVCLPHWKFKPAPAERTATIGKLEQALRACQYAVTAKARLVATGVTALVIVCSLGALRVEVDTYTLGYLPPEHQVVRDHRAIERDWGPYNVLEFLLRPATGIAIDDPELLQASQDFVRRATELPEISHGVSLEPAEVTPGDLGRIRLVGVSLSANELSALLKQLKSLATTAFGSLGKLEASGYLPLYARIIEYVMRSQIQSFTLALGLIFSFLLVGLRSLRLALIGMLPNLLPVLVMFAVMGFFGIPLDIATAGIAAIVLGVSVDDTVHYLWAWRDAERQGLSWQQAVAHCSEHAGRPAIITSLLLVAGYAVLMLGSGATIFNFGLLTCIAAVAALVGDLLLLPLLLKPFSRQETQ